MCVVMCAVKPHPIHLSNNIPSIQSIQPVSHTKNRLDKSTLKKNLSPANFLSLSDKKTDVSEKTKYTPPTAAYFIKHLYTVGISVNVCPQSVFANVPDIH